MTFMEEPASETEEPVGDYDEAMTEPLDLSQMDMVEAQMDAENQRTKEVDETVEGDVTGLLSEVEMGMLMGKLRRASSERKAKDSKEEYSFDVGV